MEYRPYIEMIRRSLTRIKTNYRDYKTDDNRVSLIHIGQEFRQIESIIDEAYTYQKISYNSFKLLYRWYRRVYDKVVHDIIWL